MTPFFSIIIPTFNSAKTISIALNSILCQTFRNWEVLIMDGVSTDQTLDIVRALNDSRIHIYSEPDKGIYDAMNKGIKQAKGEWIYFLGSDDELYTIHTLQNVSNFINLNNISILYGDILSDRFEGRYAGEFDFLKLYKQNICHQAIFVKNNVFEVIGKFNLNYSIQADYEHNIKWFLNRKMKYKYINEIIAIYADGGFSSKNEDIKLKNNKDVLFLFWGIFTLPIRFKLSLLKKQLVKLIH